ncbi:SDR family oxidoreductase [Candidatus Pelagibacter sp.]|nr:SDR family oxidoreductase [Candidatus Pelagibacter sp.]
MKIKNIILTGSEGLIGKSYRSFAEKKGYTVFCIDKKRIKRKNYFYCDITKEKQVSKTIGSIFKKTQVSLLINNAATNPSADNKLEGFKFSEYNYENWKKNLEVDLNGSFLVSKYVLKYFEKKNQGNILNISSIYGIIGPDQNIYQKKKKKFHGFKPVEYSVAKAGVIGFTKALSTFYKGTNIKINCLVLGGVESKQDVFFKKKYSEKTILNRMSELGEYNNYIDFFGSELNSYTSGSCFVVDGGATSIL